MTQITSITSEALQAQVRRLLPSQAGFSEDLQASNLITPIIDLTPTAEGSQLPESLQQAYAFGSTEQFTHTTGSTDINLTPGFYRINGTAVLKCSSTVDAKALLRLNDGASTKTFWGMQAIAGGINGEYISEAFDEVFYVRTGDILRLTTTNDSSLFGGYRQIADVYGNLVNPSGFSFE